MTEKCDLIEERDDYTLCRHSDGPMSSWYTVNRISTGQSATYWSYKTARATFNNVIAWAERTGR